MCCNALRVLQERWHPVMSWTVLQSVSRANLLFECHTTTALVLWQMQSHFLDASFVCMLLCFADTTKYVADWDHTTDGCISPMKLGACSPASFLKFFGDGMIGSRSLAFLLPHCHPCPPSCGGFDFFCQLDFWSQLTVKKMTTPSTKAYDKLTWADSERYCSGSASLYSLSDARVTL